MTDTTTLLEQAQTQLAQQGHAADSLGDYEQARLMGRAADVVDYTRRVTLDTASAHYRREKAVELLDAAMSVLYETMSAGIDGDDLDRLADLSYSLRGRAETTIRTMWAITRGEA